ncbi:MAG: hypothetical protein IJV31_01005 [Clostridia bacterium]|nr:hypothetical protein [Clostridia bacterium]MBQ9657329.1 hypothetical protein [Clostridia bacterium]
MNGIEKLITPYIYELMVNGNNIMLFPDNKQIILNEEIDEWNFTHESINNPIDRITFFNHGDGYVIHRHGIKGGATDIVIAMQDIQKGYEHLINLPFENTGTFNYEWWKI